MHTQLEGLKHYFQSGATQSYSFRLLQLKRLKQVVLDYEKELYHALHADLKKSEEESWATEIGFFINELNYTIDHLKEWMQPNSVPTNLLNQPSSCYTVREPLGVVCIIAPWKKPIQLIYSQ
ncbi:MAG: aldehyde dehydrogenase family protein, partial [Chitinophagaceae bacterium]